MRDYLQIFIEYKVKETNVADYELLMEEIIAKLPDYGAEKIEWFIAQDQPLLYVEMFKVPTVAYYHALKKYRKSKEHSLFGQLDQYIEGGLEKLNCWAFQTQSFKMKKDK